MIPTGGSSGQIRFAIHTWETLTASVTGFRHFFQVDRVHSCCVLPLYHVSGLMQFMRSFLSGGKLAVLENRSLVDEIEKFDPSEFFLSLVPTQLQRLLQSGAIDQLSRFQTILLGGAPAWSELLETARIHHIPLAPTYGMTETASQVATLKPLKFLQGKTGYAPLPHAEINICDETGKRLGCGQVGAITLRTDSLALGYFPQAFTERAFQTDDLGFLDEAGDLHLVGRQSSKIITGGENVFPAEVEAAIRSSGLVADVCVVGMPDREWGEAVNAVYVPIAPDISPMMLQTTLEQRLCKFKHPKRWHAVEMLPRTAQGKLNTAQVKLLVMQGVYKK